MSAPAGKSNGNILELEDVHTYYGSIHALKGISITVGEGEIVTLIGANGAGKSTTLRSINGLNHPQRGRITFKGKDITIAFNPQYLIDPLRNLDADEVFMELTDELSPGVVKVNEPFLYVLMPMRLN